MIEKIRNYQYHLIGAIFLVANFIRHSLQGYRTPRVFSTSDNDKAAEYDLRVVENWVKYLQTYSGNEHILKDKIVLEICPGSDLGTALVLSALGIKKYIALDINNLAGSAPAGIYEKLVRILKEKHKSLNFECTEELVKKMIYPGTDKINYTVDKSFDLRKIREKVDIVFSQAAFEHFDDVRKTLKQLSGIVKDGGILVTEIDLKTHTRWIREKDPLNIYRYNHLFWNLFKFKGSPNRVRVFEYKKILEENGWHHIEIEPLCALSDECLQRVRPYLNKNFRRIDPQEMKMLSIILMARR